jgi:hypothetical protein
MAQTTGIVQSLTISTSQACAQIGPSPSNAELLVINITSRDDVAVVAFQTSIIDALAAALASGRPVVATHGDQDAIISQMVINPA